MHVIIYTFIHLYIETRVTKHACLSVYTPYKLINFIGPYACQNKIDNFSVYVRVKVNHVIDIGLHFEIGSQFAFSQLNSKRNSSRKSV